MRAVDGTAVDLPVLEAEGNVGMVSRRAPRIRRPIRFTDADVVGNTVFDRAAAGMWPGREDATGQRALTQAPIGMSQTNPLAQSAVPPQRLTHRPETALQT